MKWPERGVRKYSAFLISLFVYFAIFSVTVFGGFIDSSNIPTLAFQLGVGIASVTGVFFASNVLSKKVSGYDERFSNYDGNYPVVGGGVGMGYDQKQQPGPTGNTGV
jgi:hypothetical protein